ncbi:MAG: helix-turn-helix domain-containing protein [Proteobacteria bacterium]|jgi:excisionase family DNA binding protein|nr:helix-turn-helix domain-containing protein [Pseudomonadota bacterium]
MHNDEAVTNADRSVAALLAELLRPAVVEAIRAEVRAALEAHLQAQVATIPPRLLNVSEAAKIAGVHAETIRRAIRAGRLSATTALGPVRIKPDVLHAFLEGR